MADARDDDVAFSAGPSRDLPFLTADLTGVGGRLKHVPEDFEVEELPAYEPAGEGEHLFLWVQKTDRSADELLRHVARVLGVRTQDIGTAGLKDRRAVARQFVSVPASYAARLDGLNGDGFVLLDAKPHRHKLRTGHLRGNRFSILVRDVSADALARAARIAAEVERLGFPNYFGEQRFGQHGNTAELGFDLLQGRRSRRSLPYQQQKFLVRLALSAAQSHLFNAALVARIGEGLLHRVLPGDVMQVAVSGGSFVAEHIEEEQRRFDARETVVTGPIFGPKMTRPDGDAATREQRILSAHGLAGTEFNKFGKLTRGTRRPYLAWPGNLSLAAEPEGLRLRFTLPSGVYATTLLREFMKGGERDQTRVESQESRAEPTGPN